MSLIGSLEDLGLGDILQIISLSQKSGVLIIRSDEGEGRIVFLDGLVRGALVKGGPLDLRGVLVGGGFVGSEEFDRATEAARTSGAPLDEALAQQSSISPERIDSLRREAVETAVVKMFRWQTGEFSFDVREEAEPEDPPIFLPTGINAQYLAMEGSRLDDEGGFDDASDAAEDADDMSAEEMFGVAPDPPEEAPPEEEPPVLEIDPHDTTRPDLEPAADLIAPGDAAEPVLEAELVDTVASAAVMSADDDTLPDAPLEAAVDDELEADEDEATQPSAPPWAGVGEAPPVVVIDPDLAALEWIKQVLRPRTPRIHIFQRSDLGLTRIRQYLARAQSPILFVSPEIEADPLSGIPDSADFARRLKAQAPRMPIVWLREDGTAPIDKLGAADADAVRPASYQFKNPGARRQLDDLAASLRTTLDAVIESRSAASKGEEAEEISPESLKRLKSATARLNDASSRGEVLPLVISFAAESFSRVAMFVVRGDEVLGMAQHGLEKAGGPDDDGLRRVGFRTESSGWLRDVLASKTSVTGAPRDPGDCALVSALGSQLPAEAYLAPIESGGQVVALLYADNLPAAKRIPDTSALEVVLHHAGLALDRAALERALAETDDLGPAMAPQGSAQGNSGAAGD